MSFHEDTPLFGMSRLPEVCPQRKPSRCFRTTADGRIPLTQDWLKLLAAARPLGRVAIQTRHAYARLVAFRDVPEFAVCQEHGYAQAIDGSLRLNFDQWHRAWGRLAECDCCGTPGRMEVHNEHGLEFLQLCPIPGCEPSEWACFLETMVTDQAPLPARPPAGSSPMSFPCLPTGARLLSRNAEDVAPLLISLGEQGVPVRCSLRTAEALHTREFLTTHVDVTDALLTAGEKASRFQIGFPAVRSIAFSDSPAGGTLHFAESDDVSLLAVSTSAEAGAREAWRSALSNAFPHLG